MRARELGVGQECARAGGSAGEMGPCFLHVAS